VKKSYNSMEMEPMLFIANFASSQTLKFLNIVSTSLYFFKYNIIINVLVCFISNDLENELINLSSISLNLTESKSVNDFWYLSCNNKCSTFIFFDF
jgi:hypothetical protein